MQPLPNHDLITKVMQQSFTNWANRDSLYGKHYKKLDEIHLKIVNEAISEINIFTPDQWDVWWLKNHMRYYKQYRQDKMRMTYQMFYQFLSLYSRGKLEQPTSSSKGNRKAKAG